MRKKKLVIWGMTMVLSMGMVVGCGGTEASTSTNSGVSAEVDEGSKEQEDTVQQENEETQDTEQSQEQEEKQEEQKEQEVEQDGVTGEEHTGNSEENNVTDNSNSVEEPTVTEDTQGNVTEQPVVSVPTNVITTLDVTKEMAEAKAYQDEVYKFVQGAYGDVLLDRNGIFLDGQENYDMDGLYSDFLGSNVVLTKKIEGTTTKYFMQFDLDLYLADLEWDIVDTTQTYPWEADGKLSVLDHNSFGFVDMYTGTLVIPKKEESQVALGTTGDVITFKRSIIEGEYQKVENADSSCRDGLVTAKVSLEMEVPSWYDGAVMLITANDFYSPWGYSNRMMELGDSEVGTYEDVLRGTTMSIREELYTQE